MLVMSDRQLAQVNVARLLAPIDSPLTQGFVDGLEAINAVADDAPGFVWRLQTEQGDATSVRISDDDMLLVNLSVWASVEALKTFVFRSDHRHYRARRDEWFERSRQPYVALWWVPVGHIPTVTEAGERLGQLRADGPTRFAFTLDQVLP